MEPSLSELEILAERAFGIAAYARTFPQIFQAARVPDMAIERDAESGAVVAFCSLFPTAWVLENGESLRGVCIGSVSTHPEHRHRGHALSVLARAESTARDSLRADFLFLFSGLEDLYRRAGFERVGTDRFICFNPTDAAGAANVAGLEERAARLERTGFGKSRSFDRRPTQSLALEERTALWRFLVAHEPSACGVLSFAEFNLVLGIPGLDCLRVFHRDTLDAAGFLGKGADFANVVHGCAARDPKSVVWMLRAFARGMTGDADDSGEGSARTLAAPSPAAFLFMPGLSWKVWRDGFSFLTQPLLFCKSLDEKRLPQETLARRFETGELYVRSLQST